jgi:hypothetical protein
VVQCWQGAASNQLNVTLRGTRQNRWCYNAQNWTKNHQSGRGSASSRFEKLHSLGTRDALLYIHEYYPTCTFQM